MLITGESKLVSAAYIAARSEIQTLMPKDGQANRSRYLTLGKILETITPILAVHDLVILQEPLATESAVGVATSILHESGASIDFGTLLMPFGDGKPQSVGSALSYARRYALTAVLGLAGDDDDGQAAQDTSKAKQPARNGYSHQPDYSADDVWDMPAQHTKKPDTLSPSQLQRIHILGRDLHGKAWETVGKKLVADFSKGAVTSSKELTREEASRLIADLEEALRQKTQLQTA